MPYHYLPFSISLKVKVHQSVIDAMCSYLQKPGAHLFGTHPGGQNTIGTVETGRQHCASFFNCLPEEVSKLKKEYIGFPKIYFNGNVYST